MDVRFSLTHRMQERSMMLWPYTRIQRTREARADYAENGSVNEGYGPRHTNILGDYVHSCYYFERIVCRVTEKRDDSEYLIDWLFPGGIQVSLSNSDMIRAAVILTTPLHRSHRAPLPSLAHYTPHKLPQGYAGWVVDHARTYLKPHPVPSKIDHP